MSTRTLRCGPWACTTVLQVALLQTKHCYPPFLGAPPSTAWGAFPLAAPPLAGTTSFSDRRGGSTNPGGSSIATLRISSDDARGLKARAARWISVCDTVLARRHVVSAFARALFKGFRPWCFPWHKGNRRGEDTRLKTQVPDLSLLPATLQRWRGLHTACHARAASGSDVIRQICSLRPAARVAIACSRCTDLLQRSTALQENTSLQNAGSPADAADRLKPS